MLNKSPFLQKNSKVTLWAILLFFMGIFSLISFVNHYLFRTYAMDLGVFNHFLYQVSHLKNPYYMVGFKGDFYQSFGAHFSPTLVFYIPFYWLFGSYGVLVVQVLSIIGGGIGIYKYAQFKGFGKDKPMSLIFVIQFFSMWGIYSALAYDFHNNVVAAMCVPWLLLFYEKKAYKKMLLAFLFIILCKENMALWMMFMWLGLALKNKDKGKKLLKLELPLMLFSAIYFIVVFAIVMPYLSKGADNHQVAFYSHLGSSLTEILSSLFLNPIDTLKLLYKNILGNPMYDGIKAELHWVVLLSGGLFLLRKPHYLVMLIPIYAQKLFSSRYELWGINDQYSIEFLPIISIAFIEGITQFKKEKMQLVLGSLIMLSTLFITLNKINTRTSKWYKKTNTAFNQSLHYTSTLPIKQINKILKTIPKNAVVSTSSTLLPHLCNRDKIYHFPIIKDAAYIVLIQSTDLFPFDSKKEFDNKIDKLKREGVFFLKYEKNNLLIFKKKGKLII